MIVQALTTVKHFSYNPVEDARSLLAGCTLQQALELSAIACLAVGEKAAELKSSTKPKQFAKKLAESGLTPTEINKYIKLHTSVNIASMAALGASMLFSLSAPRYAETCELISELPKIDQVNVIATKKNFAPKPKAKNKKTGCQWTTDRGGGNRKLEITASLPTGTLSDTPGVAEWVYTKHEQCKSMAGVLSDCYKDSQRLQELEIRFKELEASTRELASVELAQQKSNVSHFDSALLPQPELETIEDEIKTKLNPKDVYEPYFEITNLARGLKHLALLPNKKAIYDKNLKLLKQRASAMSIWFDEEELLKNHRLLFVRNGEDFISFLDSQENKPAIKATSFAEDMRDDRPIIKDEDQVERFAVAVIKYAELGSIGWEKIAAMASFDMSQLKEICKGLNDTDKPILRQCLATYLVERSESIRNGQVDWLHHVLLSNSLKLLEFKVNGQDDCRFNSVFSFNEKNVERWNFSTPLGELISCDRNQFEITGFIF